MFSVRKIKVHARNFRPPGWLAVSSVLGLVLLAVVASEARVVKELPLLVTVTDLANKPAQYDGHRVVVTGRVQSMEIQSGRRGSQFMMIILEEDAPSGPSSSNVKPVQVYSPTVPKVHEGDRALVQGVFHVEGMQAGRSFEHFVDAEVILQN